MPSVGSDARPDRPAVPDRRPREPGHLAAS